jgi:hypothetical protein
MIVEVGEKRISKRAIRAFRDHRTTTTAPNVMVGELESHHRRLRRVGGGNLWKKAFGGAGAVLCGGVIGGLLTGASWTPSMKAAAGFTTLCFLAWFAIRDTEAENIDSICADYKKDILDSFVFEEVDVVEEQ